MPSERPMIKCLPRSDFVGGMKFWCPFCKKWHLHGRGNGGRTPDCTLPDSPFRLLGYDIKMASKKELKEIRDGIDRYLGDRT